jgi:hypothetical protein
MLSLFDGPKVITLNGFYCTFKKISEKVSSSFIDFREETLFHFLVFHFEGVNFTNNLHAASLLESFTQSFFVLGLQVKPFLGAKKLA